MDRREFIKTAGISTMAVPFLSQGKKNIGKMISNARPNIILILVDDMGFADIGCYGSEIDTPNLNQLAESGIRFTQFYNCSRCCPTRASLLTGLYPHQTGVGDMADAGFDWHKPGYRGKLNHRCMTIAEVLHEAGYHTYMTGKWHIGKESGCLPPDRGFEEFFGILSGAGNYFRPRELLRNKEKIAPEEIPEGFYTTDAFTDMAIKFIKENHQDGKPYFLYLAYNAPHWPLHAKAEDIAKYEGRYLIGWDELRRERYERQISLGIINPKWRLSPRDPRVPAWEDISSELKEKMARKMAVYAGMVDCIDQNIGKLLKAIEELGDLENTLILFLSDNGACHENGAFGFDSNIKYTGLTLGEMGPIGTEKSFSSYGRAWSNAGNTPFRLHKHWVHEGGIATPLIAYWPSVIKEQGKMVNVMGHVIDIMPTCLEVTGVKYPKEHKGNLLWPLEGKSLMRIFKGEEPEEHEFLAWEHEGNRAFRKGNLKLVSTYKQEWELYDMEEDRTELNDLSSEKPATVEELAQAYEEWAKRCWVEPYQKVKMYSSWVKNVFKKD